MSVLPLLLLLPLCCSSDIALSDFLANEKGLKREEVKSWTPYPGGAPANVATALTKLGVPTAFVSALGNDERGEELMALLKGARLFSVL